MNKLFRIFIILLFIPISLIIVYFILKAVQNSKIVARWNTIYPDYSKIKYGMTKDQVVKILGKEVYKWGTAITPDCLIYTKLRAQHISLIGMPYYVVGPCFDKNGKYYINIEQLF